MRTAHRVALVTGANRGIGLEVCRQLAQHGYAVVLGSRDAAKGERAAAGLAEHGRAVRCWQLDVTDPGTSEGARARLAAEVNRRTVLVNNAPSPDDTRPPAVDADPRQGVAPLDPHA